MALSHHSKRVKGYPILLKRPNSEGPTGLFLRTSFNGKPFKYGLGVSIFPALWDKKNKRPKTKKSEINKYKKDDPHIEITLKNIELTISNAEGIIAEYVQKTKRDKSTFDLRILRELLDEGLKKVIDSTPEKEQSHFVLDYIKSIEKGMENGTVVINSGRKKGRRYSTGAIKNYSNLLFHWVKFEKSIGKRIRFNDINGDLYKDLLRYFAHQDLSANTTGRYIKALKALMSRAYDDGIHDNQIYTHKIFYAPQVETTSIYLTEDEINSLMKVDLKSKPHYQKALDVFLAGVYTAMRYSDYSRIKPEHIKTHVNDQGKKFKVIDMITRKTGERVIVPIKPELDQILQKYNYRLPKTYEQKVSSYIKNIANEAGIVAPVEVEEIVGGLKVSSKRKKYKMISTHTARRTGVCLMYLAGVKVEYIMKITGHRTEKSFRKYLRISKDEAASEMSGLAYFKNVEGLMEAV